jgi:carboxylesterase type B
MRWVLRAFLRWENIEYFGGDRNNVTLFGTSAGASSVHLHSLNEKSKIFFHKMILQSGCALNNWLIQYDGVEKTRRIAQKAKCRSLKPSDVYEALMKANLKTLALSSKKVQDFG